VTERRADVAGSAKGRLLSVEEALEQVLAAVGEPLPAESLATADALERVLAAPVRSATALPPWDNSAMDGYAIRAADTDGATDDAPRRIAVIGDVAAGAAPTTPVTDGAAVRIATGAPVPRGADAVVPVESTTPLDASGRPGSRGRDATGPVPAAILVHAPVAAGGSIRRAGSDLADGVEILPAGARLRAAGVALAAGAGVATVSVRRMPRVAVLATGDEVRAPGVDLGPAGIPDANGPGLRALVRAAGCEPVDLGIARDDLDDVLGRLERGIREADLVIVSGGVSVGPYDVVRVAFESLGRIDLWRVAVQPGKPFAFGLAPARDGRPAVPLFGLPGNPVSSFVTFELFVRPALAALSGATEPLRTLDRGVLEEPVTKSAGRRAFLRVTAERDERGAVRRDDHGRAILHLAGGAGGQGSHVLSALATAEALAVVPEDGDRRPAGTEVEMWWLDR
jgi:molybdopterin molybdotransferase